MPIPRFPPRPLPGPLGFLGFIPNVVRTDGPLQLRLGRVDSSITGVFSSLNSSLTSNGTLRGRPRFLGVGTIAKTLICF